MNISKEDIRNKARELGFEDAGFTGCEPFEDHREVLEARRDMYEWCVSLGLDLFQGTDPRAVYPECRSIIVLLENYFREGFPRGLETHYGRCYLDDDRVTRDGLAVRLKAFRAFLKEHGMDSKVPFHVPHRLAAARAGLGTFGKNCLFYGHRAARGSSFVLPLAFLVDRDFEPDAPTVSVGCPEWCRNACISACPTGALKGPRKIDPRRCISYLSYYGNDLTPVELREPMGLWVYGCDRCQNVCPRNQAWLAADRPVNERVRARAAHFDLREILNMDTAYYTANVWPHMFYMPPEDLWRWQMNAARAMGNSLDPTYVSSLARGLAEAGDWRVRAMCAWSLGRIGTCGAGEALEAAREGSDTAVRGEIEAARIVYASRQALARRTDRKDGIDIPGAE
ncbi:MAG: epoxyqueuosine reductase [Spirochaetes bacterium]|nr:MAG: epoxyqueuosine reductase [Spirochaetota bacterium]